MEGIVKRIRIIGTRIIIAFLTAGLFGFSLTPAQAADKAEAQALVDKSKGTLANFMSDANYSWLHRHLRTARVVIIFPQILNAGFFIGGSGGTGILLVRNETTGTWSEPAFYTLGSVTFGLQIGGEANEVIMLAMNQKAIDSLLVSSVKLGGDASIALGPVGGGAKGGVAVPDVTADFVSFAKSKGLYAGLNLEGSVLAVRDGLNDAYYGKVVKPADIIVKKDVSNPGAKEIRMALHKAAEKETAR
jgi:lipid-binding SYLF domain-containing protein